MWRSLDWRRGCEMTIATCAPLQKITEIELIYRNKVRAADRPIVANASDAYDLLIDYWDMNKIELLEQFKILLLDRRSACLGIAEISTGGVTSCIVDPRIIFATALKARATKIILAHNHPSQGLLPSFGDMSLTQQLVAGGRLLEIEVADHIIVTPYRFYSFVNEGVMP